MDKISSIQFNSIQLFLPLASTVNASRSLTVLYTGINNLTIGEYVLVSEAVVAMCTGFQLELKLITNVVRPSLPCYRHYTHWKKVPISLVTPVDSI